MDIRAGIRAGDWARERAGEEREGEVERGEVLGDRASGERGEGERSIAVGTASSVEEVGEGGRR